MNACSLPARIGAVGELTARPEGEAAEGREILLDRPFVRGRTDSPHFE